MDDSGPSLLQFVRKRSTGSPLRSPESVHPLAAAVLGLFALWAAVAWVALIELGHLLSLMLAPQVLLGMTIWTVGFYASVPIADELLNRDH